MTNLWKINNVDTYTTYGVALLKGSYNEIMSPPKPRTRLEHDFPNTNGITVDTTTALKYEAYRYKIKVAIIATSYSNFWTRYNALITAIATPGTFNLWIKDIGVTVALLYEGMQCVNKSRSIRGGRVVAVYEISVLEPNPTNRTYDPS